MKRIVSGVILIFTLLAISTTAQTTAFNFQGKLNTAGAPATGLYEIQFQLFDAVKDGNLIGKAVTDLNVSVVDGVFTTTLDFGAASFDGSPRFLEIGVRAAKDPDPFTILSPRQSINSIPYAVRSANAAVSDNAVQLGGVDAKEYVTTTTGATNFIQNSLSQQSASNFNIAGTGVIGNKLGIGKFPQIDLTLDVNGSGTFRTANGNVNVGTPSGETGMTITDINRADIRFDGATLKLLAGTGTGAMASTNGINIDRSGSVGIGTTTPRAPLDVAGSAVQSRDANGLVKAMLAVKTTGGQPLMTLCYNSFLTGSAATTFPCGFNVFVDVDGNLQVDFGFQENDRFWSISSMSSTSFTSATTSPFPTRLKIFQTNRFGVGEDKNFMLIVY